MIEERGSRKEKKNNMAGRVQMKTVFSVVLVLQLTGEVQMMKTVCQTNGQFDLI